METLRAIVGGAGFAQVAGDLVWLGVLGRLMLLSGTALFWVCRYRTAM